VPGGFPNTYLDGRRMNLLSFFIDGIDRFYVEEGKGAELEKQAQVGQVLVSAKIHDGYPVLTDIKGVK
jgi:uncharacterized membrane-anchored protein